MLTGKIALVTGASRGIGREIALTLAREGAAVIVNYQGSKEKAEEVVCAIQKNGGTAEAICCDVADFAAVEAMMKNIVETYGRLDILVNNAGITRDNLVLRMSEEDFDAVLNTNLKGTFHTIRHGARQMIRQRGGKIINIASVSGVLGNAGQANYAASKAGIIGLTKSMARELGSRNIQVNAIAPGFIETDMTKALKESILEEAASKTLLNRLGKPEDIAEMAAFLASGKADYITGQVICIDGGMAI